MKNTLFIKLDQTKKVGTPYSAHGTLSEISFGKPSTGETFSKEKTTGEKSIKIYLQWQSGLKYFLLLKVLVMLICFLLDISLWKFMLNNPKTYSWVNSKREQSTQSSSIIASGRIAGSMIRWIWSITFSLKLKTVVKNSKPYSSSVDKSALTSTTFFWMKCKICPQQLSN